MKKKEWKYRTSTEKSFAEALEKISIPVTKIASTATSPQDLANKVSKLSSTVEWRTYAWEQSIRMVQNVAKQNSLTWRQAATSKQSRIINAMLRSEISSNARFLALVRKNARWITQMPQDIAKDITGQAATKYMNGMRGEELTKHIQAVAPGVSISKAQLVARTETAKTQAAVTQVRSEELGIKWYVWRSSEDQRVRSSHAHMDGVLCSYSAPPAPETLIGEKSQGYYGPGEIFNCRCYAEPLIDEDYIQFPRRVYYNGQIQRMTKKQFLSIM